MMSKFKLSLILICALVALVAWSCAPPESAPKEAEGEAATTETPAPDVETPAASGPSGDETAPMSPMPSQPDVHVQTLCSGLAQDVIQEDSLGVKAGQDCR